MEPDICRVCMEHGTLSNPLIRPCICKGSIEYIHVACLSEWIYFDTEIPKTSCTICNSEYDIESCAYSVSPTEQLTRQQVRICRSAMCIHTHRFAFVLSIVALVSTINFLCNAYATEGIVDTFGTICARMGSICQPQQIKPLFSGILIYITYVLATSAFDIQVISHSGFSGWFKYRWGVSGLLLSLGVLPLVILTNILSFVVCGVTVGYMCVICVTTYISFVRRNNHGSQ